MHANRKFIIDTSILFESALYLWIIARMLKGLAISNDLAAIDSILIPASLGIVALYEITRIKIHEQIKWIPILAILLLMPSAFLGQNTVLSQGFIFAICARDTNFYKLAKKLLLLYSSFLILIIILSQLSIIPDNVVIVTGRVRSSLGFIWPSRPPNILLVIATLYVYVYKTNCRLMSLLLLLVANHILFAVTGSRNPFIFTELVLLLGLLIKTIWLQNLLRRRGWILIPVFIVCALV